VSRKLKGASWSRNRLASWLLVVGAIGSVSGQAAEAPPVAPKNCAQCAPVQKQWVELQASLKSTQSLLDRNRVYLAGLGKEDVSKAIKVKSNILILMVRLETAKNNIEGALKILELPVCRACPKGSP
jgi:hypothetical protein